MLKIDTQLSKVYLDEALKEAAQSRADRKAKNRSSRINTRAIIFWVALVPFVFLLVRAFNGG